MTYDDFITKFESHLGVIEEGWPIFDKEGDFKYQIVRSGAAELRIYSTLGLNQYALNYCGKNIYQEIFMVDSVRCDKDLYLGLLSSIADEITETKEPIMPYTNFQVKDTSEDRTFYLYVPSSFAFRKELSLYDITRDAEVILQWIIALSEGDKEFLKLNGPLALEEMLAGNLNRTSVI